jgi:hypothetical protein
LVGAHRLLVERLRVGLLNAQLGHKPLHKNAQRNLRLKKPVLGQ